MFRTSKFALLIFLLCSCSSLRTPKKPYAGADSLLRRGNFAAIEAQIERSHYSKKDRVLYYLDLGLIQHYQGKYKASNESLEAAERAIEEAFTKSISRATTSLVLSDNILVYAGEDYENVYINLFKALNYLALDRFDEAFVEIRRINEKLKVLESRHRNVAEKYNAANKTGKPFAPGRSRFQNSALGRWLSLLIYRAEGKPDDARIDLEKITAAQRLQPSVYNFSLPDLRAALKPPARGQVKVSFLSLTGQAPEKRADTLWAHTQLDQIFFASSREKKFGGQRIAGATTIPWPGIDPGYTFKLQLPVLEKRRSRVRSMTVRVDGKPGPKLQRIESLENAAKETFKVQQPLTYLKTVSRTITKGIAAAQAQRAAEKEWGETEGLIAGLLAGTAVGVTENADLRSSRFFPANASVAEIELPPGRHEFEIDYYGPGGALLYTDLIGTVEIHEHGLNLIRSVYLN